MRTFVYMCIAFLTYTISRIIGAEPMESAFYVLYTGIIFILILLEDVFQKLNTINKLEDTKREV